MTKLPSCRRTIVASNSGQILLIFLLIAAVVLTVGLAIISRSVTDVRITEQTEEAARAYSAAEAGIEEALIGSTTTYSGSFTEANASYNVAKSNLKQDSDEFVFPQPVSLNVVQTLWLANYSDLSRYFNKNRLRVAWGNEGTAADNANTPAMEIILYYRDVGVDKVARFLLDPFAARVPDPSFCNRGEGLPECSEVLSFDLNSITVDGKNLQFNAVLDLTSYIGVNKYPLFARARLLFTSGNHYIGFATSGTGGSGTTNFPSQGDLIESTGQAGESTRKVEVARLHPAPPAIFDFVLFSGQDLSK